MQDKLFQIKSKYEKNITKWSTSDVNYFIRKSYEKFYLFLTEPDKTSLKQLLERLKYVNGNMLSKYDHSDFKVIFENLNLNKFMVELNYEVRQKVVKSKDKSTDKSTHKSTHNICLNCNINIVNFLIVPCGHNGLCKSCKFKLLDNNNNNSNKLQCPICDKISTTQKIVNVDIKNIKNIKNRKRRKPSDDKNKESENKRRKLNSYNKFKLLNNNNNNNETETETETESETELEFSRRSSFESSCSYTMSLEF